MKSGSRRFAYVVLAIASIVFPILASADTITISSSLGGSQSFACPLPAACTFNTTLGGAVINIIGAGNSIAPTVQLTASEAASAAQTLTILYMASVATSGSNFVQSFSGTFAQGPTVTANFSSFYNSLANLIFSQDIGGAGTVFGMSANNSGSYALNGPFTLIERYTITLPGTFESSGISGAFAIPEPASISLIGLGLLGLGTVLRKKLVTA